MRKSTYFTLLFTFVLFTNNLLAQKDTVKIMAYNVLYYGNGCQGPNSAYHKYLNTIIKYVQPDILSMEKMASIPVGPNDKYGIASRGFADSIMEYALNNNQKRYAYCPMTNEARSDNMSVLYYNPAKFGFVSLVSSYTNITDFNTYKLYYKDPNLANTQDTTFLYVTLNHDKSGDDNEEVRGSQIAMEMNLIKKHFHHLPNMINMGDFNLHNSMEATYQTLVAPADSNFRFYDPPFYPDMQLKYPADWEHDIAFAKYLTTSTRETEGVPNKCGSAGGAKNWYDHILLSPWIMNNTNYIKYIPNSYTTLGNDGNRLGKSINNNTPVTNISLSPEVLDALYNFSNKYPVIASLEISSNTTGKSVADPEINNVPIYFKEEIKVISPIGKKISLQFSDALIGQDLKLEVYDALGKQVVKEKFNVKGTTTKVKCKLDKGIYKLIIRTGHNLILEQEIEKN